MKKRFIFCALSSAVISILFCERKIEGGLRSLLPNSHIAEWGLSQKGSRQYNRDNLYEYIDGEAELYLTYGFRELLSQVYAFDDTVLTVDIYDMGSPLNAFGLYSNYRHPDYDYAPIGTEAIVTDYGIRFYRAEIVVDITQSDVSSRIHEAARKIAKSISTKIGGKADPPQLLNHLPVDGRVAKTLRYIPRNMLNQDFLKSGLEARYRLRSGDEVTTFIVIFETAGDAISGIASLEEYFIESGERVVDHPALQEKGFSVQTQYQGGMLVSVVDRYLLGIRDLSSPERGWDLLKRLIVHVRELS